MRRGLILLAALVIVVGGVWMWTNTQLFQYIQNGEILTFEARYTPEQIIQENPEEILGANHQREMRDAKIKFYPYLLLEVKFPQANKTSQEGVIFWSMVDGEMVLNTQTWDKTHGFEDAINANASPQDFKLMQALAKNRNPMTLEQLQKTLKIEGDVISNWIDSAASKNLVLRHGKEIVLHFQNPKIPQTPQTEMNESIVTKPYAETDRLGRTYTKSQIEKAARAAFGEGFTIRTTREVYLPVYSIESVNPDGSVYTSFWNALSGQRISNWQG
jgi:hypothetical protein